MDIALGDDVSTFPNYPAPASPEQLASGPPPVQVATAQAVAQRRVTVLFRVFMLIPHFFVLYFLGIAAVIVSFIGWWAALFTGWLPEFAVSFLSGYVRWYTRVTAYGMLLTDVYPPFSFEDEPGYPVQLAVPARERLNRVAVLFRLILMIPAALLSMLVQYGGLTIVAFIAWLITLITGKMPDTLHAAYTAILRYTTRLNCYLYLLTPAYPGGLFGDAPEVAVDAPYPGGYGTPSEYGTPGGYGMPGGYGEPGGYGASPGYGVPGGYGSPQPFARPANWRLVLSSGTRRLLGLFVGLGVIFLVLQFVLFAIIGSPGNAITASNAIATMNTANDTLNAQVSSWESTTKACTTLACATAADGKAATYFSDFASTLHNTPMPSGATGAANRLYSDATKAAQDLTQLSQVTSASRYQSTITSTGLDQTLTQFDTDDTALGATLSSSS
jgi:hypothetical protein